ncbi:MAG: YceI family protein [Leptospiraceae bacterium]|nr:YceI family protein [Leptospiraceae bacterium]MCP5502098.1 YceI family protein [Leptospiraceae bacterium]
MKKLKNIFITTVFLCFSISSIYAVEITESKLSVDSVNSKMLFSLTKTMLGQKSNMNGLASKFSGSVNMDTKDVDITLSMRDEDFKLSGSFKYANTRMHETYLHSGKYPTARFVGKIASYDPATGNAKVTGDLTIHGTTKPYTLNGKVSKEGSAYLLKSAFTVDLTKFGMEVPDIKLATVDKTVELKAKIYLRKAQ